MFMKQRNLKACIYAIYQSDNPNIRNHKPVASYSKAKAFYAPKKLEAFNVNVMVTLIVLEKILYFIN